MSITSKASFKNSRVQPRAATANARVFQVTVNSTTPNTLIVPVNTNRTYITIRNENTSSGEDLRYDYYDNPNILTQGFLLKAGEAVDLETKGEIWGRGVSANVNLSCDEGEG
jgi:hypothetical protein